MADRLSSSTSGSAAGLASAIRLHVYRHFAQTGRAPSPVEIARSFDLTPSQTERILQQLASKAEALVLLPGGAYVWMAEPFSAVPTSFLVGSGERRWWGNCIWDALAILALLQLDGWVQTACHDCGAELRLDVAGNGLTHHDGVVHFAVPARDWWRSIGFT